MQGTLDKDKLILICYLGCRGLDNYHEGWDQFHKQFDTLGKSLRTMFDDSVKWLVLPGDLDFPAMVVREVYAEGIDPSQLESQLLRAQELIDEISLKIKEDVRVLECRRQLEYEMISKLA